MDMEALEEYQRRAVEGMVARTRREDKQRQEQEANHPLFRAARQSREAGRKEQAKQARDARKRIRDQAAEAPLTTAERHALAMGADLDDIYDERVVSV